MILFYVSYVFECSRNVYKWINGVSKSLAITFYKSEHIAMGESSEAQRRWAKLVCNLDYIRSMEYEGKGSVYIVCFHMFIDLIIIHTISFLAYFKAIKLTLTAIKQYHFDTSYRFHKCEIRLVNNCLSSRMFCTNKINSIQS